MDGIPPMRYAVSYRCKAYPFAQTPLKTPSAVNILKISPFWVKNPADPPLKLHYY